jgi:hypothetical protein
VYKKGEVEMSLHKKRKVTEFSALGSLLLGSVVTTEENGESMNSLSSSVVPAKPRFTLTRVEQPLAEEGSGETR